jgi:DNA-binding MarR family transcriptional regulator
LIKIEAGITADQWVILDLIFQEPGLGQFEIAEKTSKDPPTVTRILDLLVRKRLVERTADPSDRRKYIISLTAAGKETVKRLYPKVQRFRVQHFDGLSDKDMYHLLRILKQINQNIQ